QARFGELKEEADDRVARAEAMAHERLSEARNEIEQHFLRLESDLAHARKGADRAEVEANTRIERAMREAEDRVARVETEADERLARVRAEVEEEFGRLERDLSHAKARAARAEQWLALIQREIEGHLMPAFASMHDRVGAGRRD